MNYPTRWTKNAIQAELESRGYWLSVEGQTYNIFQRDKESSAAKLTLQEWLQERYDNCLRHAAMKTGWDKEGWLEDADYFKQAISLKEQLRLAKYRIAELEMHHEKRGGK